MGKKEAPKQEKAVEPAVPKPTEEEEEKEEDTKVVKDLKVLDDQYLAIEREYEREMQELMRKYTAKQAPILEQRLKRLTDTSEASEEDKACGTPACKNFWLQAMKNLPALEDQVEEWDEPVLEYLSDIQKSYVDDKDINKGYRLSFHFVENPFFTNTVVWKEYHTEENSPYTGEMDTKEIKVSEIEWKTGKNVTVETIKKKAKGGGAKKQKQKGKEKEEPRDSFFRNFFRNLSADMPIPGDINLDEARQLCGGGGGDDSDEDDDEDMMELLMENDYEMGCSIRDMLIPFAVRWYTGEANPDDFDDDDEDDDGEDGEDEDAEDEETDDDDDEDDEPPRGKKGGGPVPKKKGGAPQGKGGAGQPAEECKQQ